jgi:pyruvate/2-oxoglutarate dehydrogenase complex dihydrolipoamide acyltransferase (E2) component
VNVDDVVVIIETDKVSVDVRSPTAGVVTAFHAEEGATVQVGAPLLKLDTSAAKPAAKPAAAPAAEKKAEAAPKPATKVAASPPPPTPTEKKAAPSPPPKAAGDYTL